MNQRPVLTLIQDHHVTKPAGPRLLSVKLKVKGCKTHSTHGCNHRGQDYFLHSSPDCLD